MSGKLKIERIAVSKINPAAYNPRKDINDPQFTDPKIMEMFLRYLREPAQQ